MTTPEAQQLIAHIQVDLAKRGLGQDTKIIGELNRITEAAKSSDPTARLSIEETQFMQMTRTVARKKGKWDRFGPEATK